MLKGSNRVQNLFHCFMDSIIWLLCCLLELLLVGLPLQDFIVLANHLGLQPSAGRLGVWNVDGEFNVGLHKDLYRFLLVIPWSRDHLPGMIKVRLAGWWAIRVFTECLYPFVWIACFRRELLWAFVESSRALDRAIVKRVPQGILLKCCLVANLQIIVPLHLLALLICSEEVLCWNIIFGRNRQRLFWSALPLLL